MEICNICKENVSYEYKISIASLRRHLSAKHPVILLKSHEGKSAVTNINTANPNTQVQINRANIIPAVQDMLAQGNDLPTQIIEQEEQIKYRIEQEKN